MVLAVAVAMAVDSATPQQSAQTVPTFRASALVVPVDVRVLDRSGQPVTDLRADEFDVFEDGVAQDIKHFSARNLEVEAYASGRPLRRQPYSSALMPQSRRVFLIVLGRGRLQEPSRGVDALLHLVRARLMPQDQVAVFAYDRATAFTTDHEQIANILQRFRTDHAGIEQDLRQHFSGLAAVYGNKDLPASVRSKIDAIFKASTREETRELPAAVIGNEQRLAEDFSDPFDQFISGNRQTLQDLGNLYTGIEYLRQIEGEKHLIFVTEAGLNLPRLEDDHSLAAIASDARVTIDPIQTGGVIEPPMTTAAPGTVAPPAANSNATWRQSLALQTLKTIADLTGGQASLNAYADEAIDRINATTRFGYLVGYSPANTSWDGRYRRLRVVVRRPDVTVFYRHGYYARPEVPPANRKQVVITSRMNAALAYRRDIRDVKLKATARVKTGATAGASIDVTVAIDAARVRFEPAQNQQVVSLVVALVCLDSRQRIIGQAVEELTLRYDDAGHVQALKDGINYTGRVTAQTTPANVKVVVYDYTADLLGTVVAGIK